MCIETGLNTSEIKVQVDIKTISTCEKNMTLYPMYFARIKQSFGTATCYKLLLITAMCYAESVPQCWAIDSATRRATDPAHVLGP